MMKSLLADNRFRYERKFVVPYLHKGETEIVIKNNPFMLEEIYYERKINNIYLDSFEMDSYFDNVLGNADRTKYRIRWYGESLTAKNPVLELKIKKGLVGTKLSYPLPSFSLTELDMEKIEKLFRDAKLPDWLGERIKHYKPVLYNSYRRKYFMSACGEFRVTLDSELCFAGVVQQSPLIFFKERSADHVIIEVKYDNDADAERLTTHFPFRMTKSSKYVAGIDFFRGD